MKNLTYFQTARPQVIQSLSFGEKWKESCRLVLYNNFLVDDHVEAMIRERLSFVIDRDDHFPSNGVAAFHQLLFERQRIDVLKKPESETVVDVVKRPLIPAVVLDSSRCSSDMLQN